MLRFLSRFIGLWLLAGALVALVVDGAKTIAAGEIETTPLEQMWAALNPATLATAQAAILQGKSPWVWERLIEPIISAPGFVVFGVLGIVLMVVGRKKRELKLSELEIG